MDGSSAEKSITIAGEALDKLLGHGDGNAALLYLHTLRAGSCSIARAARELKCTEAELVAAAGTLRSLGLLDAEEKTPEKREAPEYTAQDLGTIARNDPAFEAVVAEAESALGKVLSSNDLKLLFGVYDYWGLPADVIMLLLHHCVEKFQNRYG
ncbi:MAG: DnaD domain protein, partial [Oscillospiraceae bacterium]|nr:DnaD domain protein [Oscillospiraceae bacterium]